VGSDAPAAAEREGEEEVRLYLFTWNLCKKVASIELLSQHLAQQSVKGPWIACLQELPAASWIAEARRGTDISSRFPTVRVAEIPSTERLPQGLALLHDHRLRLERIHIDEDEEFIAAKFGTPPPTRSITVVGVHAKSKIDMHSAQEHGGSRALLRHAIDGLPWPREDTIIMGDFNSDIRDVEMSSWHCFYALNSNDLGLKRMRRRGMGHEPLRMVAPRNGGDIGSHFYATSGGGSYKTLDYFIVSEGLRASAEAVILPSLMDTELLQLENSQITIGDHLPVEGMVHL
jgi:hypothetical protein